MTAATAPTPTTFPTLTYAGRRFVHVADGVVRRMTEAERDALSESIGAYGIRQQLHVTEDGRVADGWNRLALAADLGLPWADIAVNAICWLPAATTDAQLRARRPCQRCRFRPPLRGKHPPGGPRVASGEFPKSRRPFPRSLPGGRPAARRP
jgi:hypothetical protein